MGIEREILLSLPTLSVLNLLDGRRSGAQVAQTLAAAVCGERADGRGGAAADCWVGDCGSGGGGGGGVQEVVREEVREE